MRVFDGEDHTGDGRRQRNDSEVNYQMNHGRKQHNQIASSPSKKVMPNRTESLGHKEADREEGHRMREKIEITRRRPSGVPGSLFFKNFFMGRRRESGRDLWGKCQFRVF